MSNAPTKSSEKSPSPLPPFEGPKILVLKEKHGTCYYYIPNEAHLHAVALHIVTERYNEGCWYGEEEDYQDESGLSPKEQLAAHAEERKRCELLQDDDVRTAALKILDDKEQSLKWDDQSRYQAKCARVAVEKKRGPLALQLLYDRAQHEYEGFELERLENMSSDGPTIPLLPRPKDPGHGATWIDKDGGRWVYDAKTFKAWIPKIYAWLLYNVEAHQGKKVVRRSGDDHKEVQAYERADGTPREKP